MKYHDGSVGSVMTLNASCFLYTLNAAEMMNGTLSPFLLFPLFSFSLSPHLYSLDWWGKMSLFTHTHTHAHTHCLKMRPLLRSRWHAESMYSQVERHGCSRGRNQSGSLQGRVRAGRKQITSAGARACESVCACVCALASACVFKWLWFEGEFIYAFEEKVSGV